jgi:histone-lysine N-methyltransferase SETD3
MAKEAPIGKKLVEFMYDLNSPKHCLLTSYVLQEFHNPDSKWKYYLDILPKDYSNFPIFYTEEELKLLEGSPFLNTILDKKEDIKKDYDDICMKIPEFSIYTFKEFCEIRMAVSSRIFCVKIDGKKTDVLAPLADMLNHKRPRQTHWFYEDHFQAFTITALEDITAGLEIFDSYGKKCNTRFLLNYGFIVDNNDSNEYPVTLELDESHPLFIEKLDILGSDFKRKFRLQENMLESQVIDFFSFLRFVYFDGDIDKLYKILSDNKKITYDEINPQFYMISPISIENEKIILKKIEELMIHFLSKYTDVDEEENENTFNVSNCLKMIAGEKKILKLYLQFVRYCLPLFDITETEIREKLSKDYKDECPFEFYIVLVILKFLK